MSIWTQIVDVITEKHGCLNEQSNYLEAKRLMESRYNKNHLFVSELLQEKNRLSAEIEQQKLDLDENEEKIKEFESYGVEAIRKNDLTLVRDIAGQIQIFEEQKRHMGALKKKLKDQWAGLNSDLHRLELEQRSLKQQIDTLDAANYAIRAQSSVAKKITGVDGGVVSALDAAKNLKQRELQPVIDPLQSEVALRKKLQESGLAKPKDDIESIINRFKHNQ